MRSIYTTCKNVKCREDTLFYKYFIETNRKYDQIVCQGFCYQKKAIEKCGCYDLINAKFADDNSLKPCITMNQTDCLFLSRNEVEDKAFCESEEACPVECETISYIR
jgi:hypothetical protein